MSFTLRIVFNCSSLTTKTFSEKFFLVNGSFLFNTLFILLTFGLEDSLSIKSSVTSLRNSFNVFTGINMLSSVITFILLRINGVFPNLVVCLIIISLSVGLLLASSIILDDFLTTILSLIISISNGQFTLAITFILIGIFIS